MDNDNPQLPLIVNTLNSNSWDILDTGNDFLKAFVAVLTIGTNLDTGENELSNDRKKQTDSERSVTYDLIEKMFGLAKSSKIATGENLVPIEEKKYNIVRFYKKPNNEIKKRILRKNVSWVRVCAHIENIESDSETCQSLVARQRTADLGPWFDGYEEIT